MLPFSVPDLTSCIACVHNRTLDWVLHRGYLRLAACRSCCCSLDSADGNRVNAWNNFTKCAAHFVCSDPVMVTVAEPLVADVTALPVSISLVTRSRLSYARFNISPLPNMAFISPPNGAYEGVMQGVLDPACVLNRD